MDQIKFVGGLLLTALCSIAIIMFSIGFSNDNNTAYSLENQMGFNDTVNNLTSNINTFDTESVNASDTFYRSEIDSSFTSKTGGVFKLGPTTALTATDNVLNQGFKTIFGSDTAFAIFLTALISFIGTILGLLIWKTIKGNPG